MAHPRLLPQHCQLPATGAHPHGAIAASEPPPPRIAGFDAFATGSQLPRPHTFPHKKINLLVGRPLPRLHAQRHPLMRFFAPRSSLNGSHDTHGTRKEHTAVNNEAFCIIEGPEAVMDFARLQLQEIQDNIRSRRNTIFLLLEEVRRLRIQQRLKSLEENSNDEESDMPEFTSFIPFLPPLTSKTLRQYYATCLLLMGGIIMFGGLIAPMLEVKLGPGGMSYKDFISSAHLPLQLSEVDPIVASFSGGAVGVISSLIVVEINNVQQQEQKKCKYCHGTGYLACARCSGTGVSSSNLTPFTSTSDRCANCSGTAKVMCPTCLCTGMAMANESNPRIDPFD